MSKLRTRPRVGLEQLKLLLEIATSIGTLIGAVVAAWWGLDQYLDNQHQQRVQQSLQYQQRYDADTMLTARLVIDTAWFNDAIQVTTLLNQRDWVGLSTLVNQMPDNIPDMRKSISLLVVFYDELYVCVTDRICDEATALDLLGKDASSYYSQEYYFVQAERKRLGDNCFAKGLEQIGRTWNHRLDNAHGDREGRWARVKRTIVGTPSNDAPLLPSLSSLCT